MPDTFIPVNAKVQCTDGPDGFTTTVVVDPVRRVITHIVVQSSKKSDHMVPLDKVAKTDPDTIYLNCTMAELDAMPAFTETHYIKTEHHDYTLYQGGFYESPYVTNIEEDYVPVEEEQVPLGELAVHRGTKVSATDGKVGELEEFIVNAKSGKVSHFILRKGHLWGQRDITIPVSALDYSEGNTLYLKLDKQAIEQLPSVKVKRHYHS